MSDVDYKLNFVMDDVVYRKLEFLCKIYGISKSAMLRVALHMCFVDAVKGMPDDSIRYILGDVEDSV